MIVHMVHPQHGEMNVYLPEQVKENEKAGWKTVTTFNPEPAHQVAPPEVKQDAIGLSADLRTQYIAKFGKPPHHRMSDKTIMEKLNGE